MLNEIESAAPFVVTVTSIVFVTVGAVVPAGSVFCTVIVAVPAETPVTAIQPYPAFL